MQVGTNLSAVSLAASLETELVRRRAARSIPPSAGAALTAIVHNVWWARTAVAQGKPVVAINTATYWHALRSLGIREQFDGFGCLFREHWLVSLRAARDVCHVDPRTPRCKPKFTATSWLDIIGFVPPRPQLLCIGKIR
jgi:hypothetical protein